MTRFFLASALAAIVPLGSGCIMAVRDHAGHHQGHQHGTAVSTHACNHHDGCGHSWHNGVWQHHRGHVHHATCGHAFYRGIWVQASYVHGSSGHACSHHCDHHHDYARHYGHSRHFKTERPHHDHHRHDDRRDRKHGD